MRRHPQPKHAWCRGVSALRSGAGKTEDRMAKFIALYMGSVDANKRGEASPPTPEQIGQGMAAWGKWMSDHADIVVDAGGPLGKTKRVSPQGVADASNFVAGYTIIEAESAEA